MVTFVLIVGIIICVPIINLVSLKRKKYDNGNMTRLNKKSKNKLSRYDYDDNFDYIK